MKIGARTRYRTHGVCPTPGRWREATVDDNRPICETYWYTNTQPSKTALPHTHPPKKIVEESEVLYAVLEAQAPSKILLERRKRVKSKKERWAILSFPPFPLSLSTYKKTKESLSLLLLPFPPILPLYFFCLHTFFSVIISYRRRGGRGRKSVRDWSPGICLLGGENKKRGKGSVEPKSFHFFCVLCSYRSNGISDAVTAAHFFVVYMAGCFEQQEYFIWSSILAFFVALYVYSQRSHVLLFLLLHFFDVGSTSCTPTKKTK